jgi:hypothetical protein
VLASPALQRGESVPPRTEPESRRDGAFFTGCEKTHSGGRRGFQPPHKANRINTGFSHGGTLCTNSTQNPEFFPQPVQPRRKWNESYALGEDKRQRLSFDPICR